MVALAIARGSRGWLTAIGFGVAALTTLGALALVPAIRRGSSEAGALEHLPLAAAWALAWGAGVLVAFAAALHSLYRDREDGIVALLRARGHSPMAYVTSRVVGLAALLFVVVGGGATIVGAASVLVSHGPGHVAAAAQATVAACMYSACFSSMLAPVALAALGARSRAGGYFWLLFLLFVPEIAAPLTSRIVPNGWDDLVSIQGVLGAVRSALAPPGVDGTKLVRAVVMTLLVAALATLVVRAQAARAEASRS
jgi:hypothetical protein